MTANAPPSVIAGLLAWTDTPAARASAPGTWAADPRLGRFASPGDAARAVEDRHAGDAVLAALAARSDDGVATVAALCGLAPRLARIANH